MPATSLRNPSEVRWTIEDLLEEGDLDGAISLGYTLALMCMTPIEFERYVDVMLDRFDEQNCYTEADRSRLELEISEMRKTRVEVCGSADVAHELLVQQTMEPESRPQPSMTRRNHGPFGPLR